MPKVITNHDESHDVKTSASLSTKNPPKPEPFSSTLRGIISLWNVITLLTFFQNQILHLVVYLEGLMLTPGR